MKHRYDYLIVGSGLFGATFAYRARQAGKRCLVIDKRPQLGGNVYCERIEHINVHKYGAHIFHTSNKKVWDFVNGIVEFNKYTNCPVANYKGKLYNLPFNMNTFCQMWGVTTPEEAKAKIDEQKAEAVDDSVYQKGKLLKDRNIDLLEFGRSNDKVFKADQLESVIDNKNRNLNHVCTKKNGKFIYTNKQLYEAMGDAKVTIALPRSITQPEIAGDIETLTQRYWECMFSRMVMVGHAPQELIDFIGYNPVIELSDKILPEEQIADVIEHIEDYQSLVDKNRETAEKLGSWDVRMKWLMTQLQEYYLI